jgi:hypothetical protein
MLRTGVHPKDVFTAIRFSGNPELLADDLLSEEKRGAGFAAVLDWMEFHAV